MKFNATIKAQNFSQKIDASGFEILGSITPLGAVKLKMGGEEFYFDNKYQYFHEDFMGLEGVLADKDGIVGRLSLELRAKNGSMTATLKG